MGFVTKRHKTLKVLFSLPNLCFASKYTDAFFLKETLAYPGNYAYVPICLHGQAEFLLNNLAKILG